MYTRIYAGKGEKTDSKTNNKNIPHLQEWITKLDLPLKRDQATTKLTSWIFRPDRFAKDAMMRLSIEYPQIIKQINDSLDFTEKCFADFRNDAYDPNVLSADNLWDAIFSLKMRIQSAIDIIPSEDQKDCPVGVENEKIPPSRVVVKQTPPQVTIDGSAYAISNKAAFFMEKLVEANGEWINGHAVVNQPSRIVASMPKEVRSIVESAAGKGFRLNLKKVI